MKNPISLNESDVQIKTDIKNFSKNDYGFKKYERNMENWRTRFRFMFRFLEYETPREN